MDLQDSDSSYSQSVYLSSSEQMSGDELSISSFDFNTPIKCDDTGQLLHQCEFVQQDHRVSQMQDWDLIRGRFITLYIDQDLKLTKVMKIIEHEFGFVNTVSAYKKRIESWGLSKSWTADEKAKWGTIAERLISIGQSLPERDDIGRHIPWDRVRRQCGGKKISLKHLPPRFRVQNKTLTCSDASTPTSRHTKARPIAPPKRERSPKSVTPRCVDEKVRHFPAHSRMFEEIVLFHIPQWVNWCLKTHQMCSRFPRDALWKFSKKAKQYLQHNRHAQATRVLSSLAVVIQQRFQQPVINLFAGILYLWGQFQSPILYEHGMILSRYLTHLCEANLGKHNPLTTICQSLEGKSTCGTDRLELKEISSILSSFISNYLDSLGKVVKSHRKETTYPEMTDFGYGLLVGSLYVDNERFESLTSWQNSLTLSSAREDVARRYLHVTKHVRNEYNKWNVCFELMQLLRLRGWANEAYDLLNTVYSDRDGVAEIPTSIHAWKIQLCLEMGDQALAAQHVTKILDHYLGEDMIGSFPIYDESIKDLLEGGGFPGFISYRTEYPKLYEILSTLYWDLVGIRSQEVAAWKMKVESWKLDIFVGAPRL